MQSTKFLIEKISEFNGCWANDCKNTRHFQKKLGEISYQSRIESNRMKINETFRSLDYIHTTPIQISTMLSLMYTILICAGEETSTIKENRFNTECMLSLLWVSHAYFYLSYEKKPTFIDDYKKLYANWITLALLDYYYNDKEFIPSNTALPSLNLALSQYCGASCKNEDIILDVFTVVLQIGTTSKLEDYSTLKYFSELK